MGSSGLASSRLPLSIDVACHAGHRGEETPRHFGVAGVRIEVTEVVDRWLTPDHRYFEVRDGVGDLYILRQDVTGHRWELTSLRRA